LVIERPDAVLLCGFNPNTLWQERPVDTGKRLMLSETPRGELQRLLTGLTEGLLDSEQEAALASILRSDPSARAFYHEYMEMHSLLQWQHASPLPGPALDQAGPWGDGHGTAECRMPNAELSTQTEGSVRYPSESSAAIPPVVIQTFPSAVSALPSFIGSAIFSYLMAAAIVGVGMLVASAWKLSDGVQLTNHVSPKSSERPIGTFPGMKLVGRITGMLDCQWSDPTTEAVLGAHVPVGRTYALSSGLMEITYDTGAKVILQGPVAYQVESSAGGFLAVGKLTARLEKKSEVRGQRSESATSLPSPARGRGAGGEGSGNHGDYNQPQDALTLTLSQRERGQTPSPLFAVRTPTAVVTDLGTEFGVEVDKRGCTQTHVFRGVVRLQVTSSDGKAEGASRMLHENQSARVEASSDSIAQIDPSANAEFVRAMPRRYGKVLDLVDLVAGGDGFSQRRNRGIDPTSGQVSGRSPCTYAPTFAGDHGYHRVDGVPGVDGVFIPNGAAGAVQVDSAGHRFDGFGKTDNLTYSHIWAGGSIAPVNAFDAVRTNLGGADDYAAAGHGLLLVHANSGITFDLEAVRRLAKGAKVVRFRAVAGNAAAFTETQAINSDVWVLVDGKQRFVRGEEPGRGGPVYINVPLKEGDRFLTLAFTDGGDGCGWDSTIFGDPQLEVVVTETKPAADAGEGRRP
jgi:hypothetical protein